MKIAFATCVKIGLSCIESIFEIGGQIDLLITLKDDIDVDKSGRIYLDEVSKQYDIDLLKINSINEQVVVDNLKKKKIDWLFIIGWSQIAKKNLLDTPNKGCIGIHPSLLPQGRGRAAIPWAIIKRLDKTGVTLFKLDEGVDTGDIIGQIEIKLTDNITATQLYNLVNESHKNLITRFWFDIVNNKIILSKQEDSLATYWPGRKPKDGEIFENMCIADAEVLIRAVTHPYPGAYFINNNKKITIWKASTSKTQGDIMLKDGYLQLEDYEIEEII
jgi:methionyl-tRNA formyltransferase